MKSMINLFLEYLVRCVRGPLKHVLYSINNEFKLTCAGSNSLRWFAITRYLLGKNGYKIFCIKAVLCMHKPVMKRHYMTITNRELLPAIDLICLRSITQLRMVHDDAFHSQWNKTYCRGYRCRRNLDCDTL